MDFGIYIHWPFCKSKCPYCDFYSCVPRKLNGEYDIDFDQYYKSYCYQLEMYHKENSNKVVSSIFFGGGTPSLLPTTFISKLINKIRDLWNTEDYIEVSLEGNPSSLSKEYMYNLKKAGINRLSIGVQSLFDNDLKFLGRLHDSNLALDVIKKAKEVFENVSIDLIYARPNQTLKSWNLELEKALSLNLNHYSLYQLTIEENTNFYKRGITSCDDDLAADLYEMTNEVCEKNGIFRYEVSNHAVPGFESKHNNLYWQGGEWIGVGPSAHGRYFFDDKFFATSHENNITKILQNEGFEKIVLNTKEKAEELILTGLRTRDGIDCLKFRKIIGKSPLFYFDSVILENYIKEGLVLLDENFVKLSNKGILLLNSICSNLIK